MAKTFAQLKEYTRAKANMENSAFVGTNEETYVINDAYRELYHMLVDGFEGYYVESVDFTLSGSPYTQTVATDFYKLVKVERLYGEYATKLEPYNFASRSTDNRKSAMVNIDRNKDGDYTLVKRDIRFKSKIDGDYRYWYVPDIEELSLDTDEISVECERFWKFISLTAAIEFLTDEESDTSQLERQLAKITTKIEKYLENRQEENYTIANNEEVVSTAYDYTDAGAYYI